MPLPIIPVISALSSGATLVPHAAGGLIATSTGGYVAGTYLSTTAIGGLIAAVTATAGAGTLLVTGAASSMIGSAGIFGTTTGATGLTGMLMSAGIISATPIWVPFAIGGAAATGTVGLGYGGYRLYKLKRKTRNAPEGVEAQFTEAEARFVEKLIRRFWGG